MTTPSVTPTLDESLAEADRFLISSLLKSSPNNAGFENQIDALCSFLTTSLSSSPNYDALVAKPSTPSSNSSSSLTSANSDVQSARLHEEISKIEGRMRDLAKGNFSTALHNSTVVSETFEKLSSLESRLSHLAQSAPALLTGLNKFLSSGSETVSKCKLIQQTFRELPSVIEILEIPSLISTCIRCGAYEEALQLDIYARHLLVQCPKSRPLIGIVSEVDKLRTLLQRTLEESLRGSVQLPSIVRAVGLLGRLGVYSTKELRMVFLLCRDSHFTDIANNCISEPVPTHRLSRLADIVRTTLFDVATQYRAIFSDSDSDSSSYSLASSPSLKSDKDFEESIENDAFVMLHSWSQVRISWFLDILKRDLQSIKEGSSLANLLDQCMYLGLSLGRVGLDIRGPISQVFTERIFSLFDFSCNEANNQLRFSLSTHKFPRTRLLSPLTSSSASPSLLSSQQQQQQQSSRISPSMGLLDHQPLAIMTNAYTIALNELRQCAPLCLCKKITQQLEYYLKIAIHLIYEHSSIADPADSLGIASFCEAACDEVIPYIARCFDYIWHSSVPLIRSLEISSPLEKFCKRVAKNNNGAGCSQEKEERNPDTPETNVSFEADKPIDSKAPKFPLFEEIVVEKVDSSSQSDSPIISKPPHFP